MGKTWLKDELTLTNIQNAQTEQEFTCCFYSGPELIWMFDSRRTQSSTIDFLTSNP